MHAYVPVRALDDSPRSYVRLILHRMTSRNRLKWGPGTDMYPEQVLPEGVDCYSFILLHHTWSFLALICLGLSENSVRRNVSMLQKCVRLSESFLLSTFERSEWRPAAVAGPQMSWREMIKSRRPWKAAVSVRETQTLAACLDRGCVAWHLTRAWWGMLRIVWIRRNKRMGKRESVCHIASVAEWVKGGEGSRGDISSAVWLFPPFPREAVLRTLQKTSRQPTTNWTATKEKRRQRLLFVGDWIIAVVWDSGKARAFASCL